MYIPRARFARLGSSKASRSNSRRSYFVTNPSGALKNYANGSNDFQDLRRSTHNDLRIGQAFVGGVVCIYIYIYIFIHIYIY